MAIAYINGEWGEADELKVSVLDRGFLFGDAVYEVMSVYNGVPFALDRHLARLEKSLGELGIELPLTRSELEALLKEAVERSGAKFVTLYLQISRGRDSKRDHVFPQSPEPTVFVMATPAERLKTRDIEPISVVTLEDFRWGKGHIKSVSILANGLLRNEAIKKGVDDALLIRDGYLTESTASNVFIVKDGEIRTPPKSNYLLHGITRDLVVMLAWEQEMKISETQVSVDDLREADEIWITNTSQEVWPVGVLDGQPVKNGGPGPVFTDMDRHFQQLKRRLCGDW